MNSFNLVSQAALCVSGKLNKQHLPDRTHYAADKWTPSGCINLGQGAKWSDDYNVIIQHDHILFHMVERAQYCAAATPPKQSKVLSIKKMSCF